LECHAHQAVCWEIVDRKSRRILSCSTQGLRFGLGAPYQRPAVRRKETLHTVRPAMLTTSVNCSPVAVDPSP
jgi:hypothetical protein